MFLYRKFFGRNPVEAELPPAAIENTTRNSTGFFVPSHPSHKRHHVFGRRCGGIFWPLFALEEKSKRKWHIRKRDGLWD